MSELVAERQELIRLVQILPDDKVEPVLWTIEDYLEPDEETREAIEDTMTGRNLIGPFDSVEDFMAAMLSDDDEVQNLSVKKV